MALRLWRRVASLRLDTVRAHLVLLALAVIVPLTAFAVAMVAFVLGLERQAAEQRVLDAARTVALSLDREIASAETALRVLANSDLLRRGDLAGFHAQALAARTSDDAWILLFDKQAQQIVNTRFPAGAPLVRRANPELVERVLATRQPSVSDLYVGALTKRLVAVVDVPVIYDGEPRYVLSQAFYPQHFDALLTEYPWPPDWIIAILDKNGTTVTRSHRAEDFVGGPARPELVAAARRQAEGTLEHTTRDGVLVHDAFTRSRRSGWIVAAGAPVSALDAPGRRVLLVTLAGAVIALGVGVVAAAIIGRRLSAPLVALRASARAIGRGEEAAPTTARVAEIRDIGAALRDASLAIRAREEDNRHLLGQSEAANRAKDEFLATVSHELRTPLNAMLGWIWLLRAGSVDPSATARALETIERNGRAQARLIEDLIDMSRIAAGTLRIERERVELGRVVATAIQAVRPAADAKSIAIAADPGAPPLFVLGDRARLEQVIVNVLSNAVKFTPAGGHVDVRLERAGAAARLTVRDDGVGIAPDVLPHVFDHFRQGDQSSSRRFGGLGLGLAIVKQLVEMHQGAVTASSAGTGRGAAFEIRLPLAVGDEAPAESGAAGTVGDLGRQLEGLRVLAVDDDPDTLELVAVTLRLAGAEVVATHSATEAFEAFERRRPDVIVSDIGMPDRDGYALLDDIRALDPGAPPAIALTAHARRQERDRALAAGFASHVPKPVEPDQLVAAVRAAAAGARPPASPSLDEARGAT